MFENKDLYPSNTQAIDLLVDGLVISEKVILDPSAGTGNILNYCRNHGAKELLACENHPQLREILSSEFKLIGEDFLKMESHQISHVDLIIMNPPFSADEKHILHAYNIAAPGTKIHALCNWQTIDNPYNLARKELANLVEVYGSATNLGDIFNDAERKTNINIGLVRLQKPGSNYNAEFEGFFTEDEPAELQGNGIMQYNSVRDLVNRYVAAVKLFDEQLELGVKMNKLTAGFYTSEHSFQCTESDKPKTRNDFKKDLQKAGWKFIFSKMNMDKYSTKSLKEEMNKFVEQQTHIPFTMQNIYRMLDIVIQTNGQRMDKALLEVFDKLTSHYHDNRMSIEGWKTNSHYLVNQRFILPYMTSIGWGGQMEVNDYTSSGGNKELMQDFVKALCYITGTNFDNQISLSDFCKYRYKLKDGEKYLNDPFYDFPVRCKDSDIDDILKKKKNLYEKGIKSEIEDTVPQWGSWFDWGFFRCKGFKKGSMHFEFKDLDVWGKFNQHISRIKGFPLYEYKEQTDWQKRQNKKAA